MDKFVVLGTHKLKGTITVGGSKNSSLPIMAGTILAQEGECVIRNIPRLRDTDTMAKVINVLGGNLRWDSESTALIDTSEMTNYEAPYDLVKTMRASFFVMGPLLARLKKARVSMPGGCAIGTRPVDIHLKGFEKLGAEIRMEHGYIEITGKKMKGADIYLDFPSVGATENLMMTAVLTKGITTIDNAAQEPEIADLADFLNKLGADVEGAGTSTIRIKGTDGLVGCEHTVIPDRIEAGTFIIAGLITGGELTVVNAKYEHLRALIHKLQDMGANISKVYNGIKVKTGNRLKSADVRTMPYPGFPTDIQPMIMSLLCVCEGASVVTETIYEKRFIHVAELMRMGAQIKIESPNCVLINGVEKLSGANVMATDIRAGAGLVLAGLSAVNTTEISRVYHIDRGYEKIEEKLSAVGADIRREKEPV